MSSSRRARQYALQGLFFGDINELGVGAALAGLWSGLSEADALETERPPTSEEIAFCEQLVRGVHEHQSTIDGLIEECSTNWRLTRMPLVDRNILRIAAFELLHCTDIPVSVSMTADHFSPSSEPSDSGLSPSLSGLSPESSGLPEVSVVLSSVEV